jgi:hypothetical protein
MVLSPIVNPDDLAVLLSDYAAAIAANPKPNLLVNRRVIEMTAWASVGQAVLFGVPFHSARTWNQSKRDSHRRQRADPARRASENQRRREQWAARKDVGSIHAIT